MSEKLQQDIKFLPGMGPKRSELLNKELNVFTIHDLLYYFPYKYIDRSKIYSIHEINPDLPYIQIKGRITGFEVIGFKNKKRLVAHFTDGTGVIELVWFQGYKYIAQGIKADTEYIAFGKPTEFSGKVNIIHPELEEAAKVESAMITSSLQAHYNTSEKLKNSFIHSKFIHKMQAVILKNYLNEINETLPEYLLTRLKLLSLKESLLNIHFPQNPEMLRKAEFRLKFEELFYIQLALLKLKVNRDTKFIGHVFPKVGEHLNYFYKTKLPFELTNAQKRVIKEIRKDLGSGKQMNRLLQGDVGSGKTLVALMSMLIALDNGFQACLMAPTEILAQQHFETISMFLAGLDIKVHLLTGTTKKKERKIISEGINNGSIHILIGTHAVIEGYVSFANLGLAIIDEQHRFGVAQRAKLRDKNGMPPHILVMTATPIPRTLAMTIYGDLDVSVIDELPPGRKSIKTFHYYETKRALIIDFIKKQIEAGTRFI
jgi:ATP-dependent DNA helicase RecG